MPVQIPQIRRIEFNDEEIGMGFNSQSGLAVGTALEGFTVQENPVSSGQEVFASISIINSHEELMKSLGMAFEAQGRYGFISASAKAEFSESSKYNSTSTFLVARCIVQNPLTRGQNFNVRTPAQQLLNANRFDEFKVAFGDSFVRGLQTGGEYYCVIRITSVSSTKQNELSASVQAAYNGFIASGEFKAKFAQANESESTRSEYNVTMYQKAGTGTQISPTVDISEAITRFKDFPAIVGDNPVAYETEIATYDTLPLPVPTPDEQEAFVSALRDAREKKLRYIQIRNDLEFALRNPSFFESLPANDVLSTAISVYTKLINAVTEHAIKLSRGQIDPPRFFDPSEVSPPIIEPAPILLQRVRPTENARIVAEVLSTNGNTLANNAIGTAVSGILFNFAEERAEFRSIMGGLLGVALSAIIQSCREGTMDSLDEAISFVNGNLSGSSSLVGVSPEVYILMLQNIEASAGFSGGVAEVAESKFSYIIQRINR
jgi:hypothetical protein